MMLIDKKAILKINHFHSFIASFWSFQKRKRNVRFIIIYASHHLSFSNRTSPLHEKEANIQVDAFKIDIFWYLKGMFQVLNDGTRAKSTQLNYVVKPELFIKPKDRFKELITFYYVFKWRFFTLMKIVYIANRDYESSKRNALDSVVFCYDWSSPGQSLIIHFIIDVLLIFHSMISWIFLNIVKICFSFAISSLQEDRSMDLGLN